MSWTDPGDMDGALTGDALPLAWWNAVMADLLFLYDTPKVAVRLTSSQEIADATTTTVSWDEVVWENPAGEWWDSEAPTKLVIPRAGIYTVNARTLWDAAADGTKRAIFIHVNGDSTPRAAEQIPSTDPTEFGLVLDSNFAEGDEIDIRVRHLNGEALDLLATRTRCTVMWQGPPPPE